MRTEDDLPWLAAPLSAWRSADLRSHALIVQGGIGSGLFELCLRLAQAWLCEQPPGPCEACSSCHLARAQTHPDLHVVMPETWKARLNWGAADDAAGEEGADGEAKTKRKPSREIRIDAIRSAIAWAQTSSGRNRGKVLLLFPADAMNAVSANALLKTLEEPGRDVRLILATEEPAHLLPTIRSRCQCVRFPDPEPAAALAFLRQAGLEGAEVLLRAAAGQPLAALDLAGSGVSADAWTALPRQVAQGNARQIAAWPLPLALRSLQQLCHDLMVSREGGEPRFFPSTCLPPDPAEPRALSAWSQALMRARRHDEHPWQGPLLIEALVGQAEALWPVAGAPRARYT
jgi:DNA polymerase-3 subunit delta'